MVSQIYACFITHQIVHFKYMQFIICQFYLNKTLKKRKKEMDPGVAFSKDPFSGDRKAAQDLYMC